MKTSKKQEKLRAIIGHDNNLAQIFGSERLLDEKRLQLRDYLSNLLISFFDDSGRIPPLEWIICRDAIWVLRNILAPRSEMLAEFSLLEYLDDQLNRPNKPGLVPLTADFLAELEHLIRGVTGLSGLYQEKAPAFLKHSGRKAAKLRSTDLSQMARRAAKFIHRHPSGLDDELVRRRSLNRQHIMGSFDITDLEWNDHRWQTANIIRSADKMAALVALSDEEYRAIAGARKNRIPFGVTPYYLSLMDRDRPGDSRKSHWDSAIRAQVIPPGDYVDRMTENKADKGCSMDFMIENDTSPIEGITRRYPNIVILKPILTCPQICVYCQRNWQIEDVYSRDAALGAEKLDRALRWIEETPEINEVLVTGGDPFLLDDDRLDAILSRLSANPNILRIRIGSRTPVTLPQRITEPLVRIIGRYHQPGVRELLIVTHFEHATEITPEAMQAVQRFRRAGIDVYNQLVYTYYNSKKFEAVVLRQKLRLIGVSPYYTFNTKGKEETDRYRVPICRLLQEQHEEARLMPGTVRTDEIVFNVPKLGKNYLRAAQNRDLISILPNGQRVYEFHPWEKKLALVDTYVYTDVSIYRYLKRLREDGEQIKDYSSIWYYY